MNPRVLVIGSGLSAVGAIKALVAKGIRPTVLDVGENLDSERANLAHHMAKKMPGEWIASERNMLSDNPSLKDGSKIPKKLLFGSDYFYGKSTPEAPINAVGNYPPFSYALGGLSAGWGAAVLPPRECDISDWPISVDVLNKYCAKVLNDLPYSAKDDGLSLEFPILSPRSTTLRPSSADQILLDALAKSVPLKKDRIVYGQARLLVSAGDNDKCCRYCGYCMSGCVYGAIYKADADITAMRQRGDIEYLPGHLVEQIAEKNNQVKITSRTLSGAVHQQIFDRVFLAAGAVNSTRIILQSLRLNNVKVPMLSRGGFVIPMLSLRSLTSDWPNCNTQPGIFLEFRSKWLKHWVHVQVSPENELLLQKLSLNAAKGGYLTAMKRFLATRIVLLFVNYHSDHSGFYKLWLGSTNTTNSTNPLNSVHKRSYPQWRVWLSSWAKLFSIFIRIGCVPFFPLAKLNSGAYHVGGTLPMKESPASDLETDSLGRIAAWKHVHIVDTAIFPSLPGTTIGLLTMANAYRIVDSIKWYDD